MKKKFLTNVFQYIFFLGIIILITLILGYDLKDYNSIKYLTLSSFFLFHIFNYIYSKYFGNKPISSDQFLDKIISSDYEFCLLIRPFGNDADIKVKSKYRGTLFNIFFSNWSKNIYLEKLIQSKVKKYFKINCYALVNPKLKFLPTSPKFILSNSNNWQNVIFDLVKNSLFVFIIIPSGQNIRESFKWEIIQCIKLGLIGRFAIIIPEMSKVNRQRIISNIKKELYFLSISIADVPESTFIIYPEDYDDNLYFWHLTGDFELDPKTLEIHLEELINRMKLKISDNRKDNYLYKNVKLEDMEKLTLNQIQFLKNNI